MTLARYIHCLGLLLIGCLLGGCATTPQAGWWQHLGQSAREAVRTPAVWAPLAGAAVMTVNNWDHHVSDWAVQHTPVFGSQESALRWSDHLLVASGGAMYLSVLAVPSGPESPGKLQTLAVDFAGTMVNGAVTQTLKHAIGRERPNAEDQLSFPSGHSSTAFTQAALANHNLRQLPGPWPEPHDTP